MNQEKNQGHISPQNWRKFDLEISCSSPFCYLKCAATYIPKQLTQWNLSHAQSAHIWVCAEWETYVSPRLFSAFYSVTHFCKCFVLFSSILKRDNLSVFCLSENAVLLYFFSKSFSPCEDAVDEFITQMLFVLHEENHTDCKYISNQTKIHECFCKLLSRWYTWSFFS